MAHVGERLAHVSATRASTFILGVEHEVVDDELLLVVKEIAERNYLVARAMEDILFVYLDHGQFTTLSGENVALVGICFFLLEKSFASGEPLFSTANLLRYTSVSVSSMR